MSDSEPMVQRARTDDQIQRCHAVMAQLRPDVSADEFVARVRRMEEYGYELAYLEKAGKVVTVAGYRLGEGFLRGPYLYVYDLVTDASVRSAGYGGQMFDWLVGEAKRRGCRRLSLDSAVHRFAAHRFYLVKGMDIVSHHFALDLPIGEERAS